MAFTKETLKYLAGLVGMTETQFNEAYTSEKETGVELPKAPFKAFATQEDLATYENNIKAPEYGRGVDDGKKNASEIIIKQIKESEGLSLTNSQLDPINLVKALKTKYGSKNEELINQFDKDKAELLGKIQKTEQEYQAKLTEKDSLLKKVTLKTQSLEGIKAETKIDKFDAIDLVMKDIQLQMDAAGKEYIYYKGVQQRDANLEPLSMAVVTDNVLIEKGLYKSEAGRGKGNEKGDGVTSSYKAFVKEMQDKGVHQGSATYNDEFSKRMDDAEFAKSVEEA